MSLGSRTRTYKQGRRGSLLIEVLLSIMILSTALTFMIQTMTSTLRAIQYGSGYTMALILLDNQMCEVFLKKSIKSGLSEKKDLTEAGTSYSYSMRTEPSDLTADKGINVVEATIAWRSGKRDNRIDLTTFLFTALP